MGKIARPSGSRMRSCVPALAGVMLLLAKGKAPNAPALLENPEISRVAEAAALAVR